MNLKLDLSSVESTNKLLIILIIIIIFGIIILAFEGMTSSTVNYDKYKAAYNQERDDAIGATPSGDPLNKKIASAWTSNEGLMGGGFEVPSFWDEHQYNLEQKKGDADVITSSRPIEGVTEGMDDPLAPILRGERV
jgi:hypothetical protein